MPIELSSDKAICFKCGTAYGRRKGNFPVSYSVLAKGVGYLHVCKPCVDSIYNAYLAQCKDPKDAVRQTCRKLDLYWSDAVFEIVSRKTTERSMMTQYIAKINTVNYAGKSYDDTLTAEGTLWAFGEAEEKEPEKEPEEKYAPVPAATPGDVDDGVIAFWGAGYSPEMYAELEQRRVYWMNSFPQDAKIDVVTEALLRQVCFMEIDINRDRALKKSVDKKVSTLNTLLSTIMKQTQKQDETDAALDSTPLGVWLYRYENKRPLPEVDKDLRDTNHILRYVFIWLGHVCKMLGKKNGFERMYEEEIAKYRVEHPEYEDEDDEEMLTDVLDEDEEGGEYGDEI